MARKEKGGAGADGLDRRTVAALLAANEELRADVARITAERDQYRVREEDLKASSVAWSFAAWAADGWRDRHFAAFEAALAALRAEGPYEAYVAAVRAYMGARIVVAGETAGKPA